jgi:hypothetical protein
MRPDIILKELAAMSKLLRVPQAVWLCGFAATLPLQGCVNDILQVTDPDIITDEQLDASTAAGAVALHNGVILRLAQAVGGVQGPDALFAFGGLLTDEWRSGDTFIQRNTMDQRIWNPQNTFHARPFRAINRVRVQARAAIDALREYQPSPAANIARMFAFIAYVEVLAGEHYCNGVPLSSFVASQPVFGEPLSNDSLFALAASNADSALVTLGAADAASRGADSLRVKWLASVVKGRALLDREQFAAAATAVAGVPDTFHYDVTYSLVTADNQNWALNVSARRYTLGDSEGDATAGGNVGLPYFSANDPRLPRRRGGPNANGTISSDSVIFDTAYPVFVIRQGIWGRTSAIRIVTGVEARLIEAEAELNASPPDYATWLTKINGVRTTALVNANSPVQSGYTRGPALTALADPGTDPARVDLTFRERAFWMFGTGHRLGDMRRLLRQYGRTENSVYPNGAWFKGGNYGDAIQMSIPFDEQNNPNFTQCTDRSP